MSWNTSTLNMNAPRPKNKDPKFIRSIVLMTEDKMPPRKRYSRRFANRAAPVKHAKIAVDPRNAIITILHEPSCQRVRKNWSRFLSSLVPTTMTTYIIHLSKWTENCDFRLLWFDIVTCALTYINYIMEGLVRTTDNLHYFHYFLSEAQEWFDSQIPQRLASSTLRQANTNTQLGNDSSATSWGQDDASKCTFQKGNPM